MLGIITTPAIFVVTVNTKLVTHTPRTDHVFLHHDLDPSGHICSSSARSIAHVTWWELCNLHDLAHVSWAGSVPCRSWTTSHNGRRGATAHDLDHDLSGLYEACIFTRYYCTYQLCVADALTLWSSVSKYVYRPLNSFNTCSVAEKLNLLRTSCSPSTGQGQQMTGGGGGQVLYILPSRYGTRLRLRLPRSCFIGYSHY